ncbi:hypothetical protein MMC27_006128 [Xylographa pallens]|nr:hypothetical protein [Xylographa pallens]
MSKLANSLSWMLKNAGNILDFCRRDRILFSGTACTAWALLLRCYTGQDQVTFEYTTDNAIATASLLRMSFGENNILSKYTESARDAIAGIKQKRLTARHNDTATVDSGMVSSVVNTAVCICDSGTPAGMLGTTIAGRSTEGHVTLVVKALNGTPSLSLVWRSSDASLLYMQSLADTLSHVLQLLAQSSGQRLKEVDYLSDTNKDRLYQWNQIPFAPVDRCVTDLVYEQVLARPEHEAVCAWDGSLTYRNFWRYVHSLAQSLANKGVGPGVVVPLCMEKSVWAPVAMLAVMEAGAGFCPLDATQPIPRLKSLIGRLEAGVLLCSRKYCQTLAPIVDIVVPVDAEMIENLPEGLMDKLFRSTPSDVAYVLWTSGSTGEPKGVVIEHRAYCASATAHASAYLIDSNTRILQYASYVFDASMVETLTALMVGATICIPSEFSRLNSLSEAMIHMRVTFAEFTPSVVNFLDPSELPDLRTLLLMGEGMSRDNMTTWSRTGIRLFNAYGPAECSVVSTLNPDVPLYGEPSLIGYPLKVKTWVVDPENHDRLVPPGCTGELLIEGPTLARGYLNDIDRTRDAFIENPAWAQQPRDLECGTNRRMYKTGDLVRYRTSNGMLYFIGRKDTQVKHHGQRIELGDIEYHLRACPSVKRGIVVLPKVGLCSGRLVAAISLEGSSTADSLKMALLVDPKAREEANSIVDAARKRLSIQLPAFMLPSIWLVFQWIPLLNSGKMDRKALMSAIQDISDIEYARWVGSGEVNGNEMPATEIENQLRLIWAHVLNLQPTQISLNKQSFLSLGGDSISAMTVQSHCKKRNIGITVQDILRAKSVHHLTNFVETVTRNTTYDEKIEEDFDLSPIQRLYFEFPRDKGHFNQSFFVRLTKPVDPAAMHQAAKTIVTRHSMLRARFHLSALDDEWKQRITSDVAGSYSFHHIRCASKEDAVLAMSKSQASLDPVDGPLFAVDLFDVDSGAQLLFMTAHHLVVDLVSWRVILEEVEELLTNPTAGAEAKPCLNFQAWCRLQEEDAQRVPLNTVLPTSEIPAQSFNYWGVKERENTYGNVSCKGFELDAASTFLLISKCHEAFRTEPLDFLLAAMIHSFSRVFTDRTSPAIFNEGHGREVWDRSLDLSRTVGWFTTMYPVYIDSIDSEDFTNTLRRVKDYRRSVPGNGRPYFASRLLTAKGAKRFGRHWPLEITFNYLGTYQQLERENALLVPAEEMAGEARSAGGKADYGYDTPRFGLFEISAVVVQGKLRYSFTFNRDMKHLDRVDAWISECHDTLRSMPSAVAGMARCPTLSDYPLLPLDYNGLQKLTSERLPSLRIDIANVEDIYRCSQIQQGLVISTKRDEGMYAVEGIYKVQPVDTGVRIDSERLAKAWRNVVNRHASLRTLFIESLSQGDLLYDQLVLRHVDARIEHLACESESDVDRTFTEQSKMKYSNSAPAHRLTICETSNGKVFLKLEISHTLIDGASMDIIYKDIVSSYEGKLLGETGPLYSSYISFLLNQPLQTGLRYWKSFLSGVEPTSFPVLKDSSALSAERKLHSQRFECTEFEDLQNYCELHGVTIANVFHVAWALTLQAYTGSEDICFGYLTSVRDPAIKDVDRIVGYLVNMAVGRVALPPDMSVTAVMQQVQKDFMEAQAHRQIALSEVTHALKLSGTALFNTCLSYRKLAPAMAAEKHEIFLEEHCPYYDPTEYNLSINIEVSEESAAIDLDYWTDCLSDSHAINVANSFFHALRNIVGHSEEKLAQLNSVSEPDRQLIMSWNKKIPSTVYKTVHEVVSEQAALRPNKEAICAWDASFTFTELETLAEKLAGYLRFFGVGPESFVCLCCEKSAYTPVTMLGVLKAGGAFTSLDPMYPTEALKLRIKDTQARIILTSPCYNSLFDGMGLQVVSVDAAFLDQLQLLPNRAVELVGPSNPCCIIYTSGSTGQPKGVVLEHSALVTSAAAHGSVLKMDEGTRFLQYASYTFDNCLEETFTTLMRGGTVCVPSDHDRMNDVAGACMRLNANWIDLTPTVAMYLNPAEMRSVKYMSLGGEALTKAVVEVWGGEVEIHAQYGPCECSINSTHRTIYEKDADPTSIGTSVGSVSWIVDPTDYNRLVPIGREGELLIEGPILARGYLNDREKTAKAFIKDPDWAQAYRPVIENHSGSRRMYKTGDLVRYNTDGTMDYCGRKDHQVKLNGQRIELGEIEYHIKTHLPPDWQFGADLIAPSGLKMLALFACPQKYDSATTTGSTVLPMSTELQTTFRSLEAALAKSLPKHMVPSMYIPLANLPLSSSGKLDRKQLKQLAQSLTENQVAMYRLAGNSGRQPSSEVEKTLAGLWEDLLKLEAGSIGMDSQFFRMGGDSIAAIRLVTTARSKGINLTVASIFRNAVFSEMCASAQISDEMVVEFNTLRAPKPFELLPAHIPANLVISEVLHLCNAQQQEIVDVYPCTPMQEGLIALSSKKPGAYVAQTTYRMTNIDVEKFKNAWQAVVATENILRTRIVFTESFGFLQTIVNKPIVWSEPEDLDHLFDAKEFQEACSGGNLSDYAIVKGGDKSGFFFVWTIHHALYDRWSVPMILQKVRTHYYDGSLAAPTKAPLFPQFIRFLLSEDKAKSAKFWQSKLTGTMSPQFPTLPKPTYQPSATGRYLNIMPLSRKPNAELTIPMLIRSAWGLTISAYSNSDDVVFGEIFSGRDTPLHGIENMIGPTFATVPIRVQAKRDLKVGDYLKQFQKDFTEALPYQHMGLLRITRINSDTKNACEFQNLISINNEVADTSDFFGVEQAAGSGSAFFTYGLTVSFDVHASEMELEAHYDPHCISQWQIERLLKYFEYALNQLSTIETDPSTLGEMRMLHAEDEATIRDWNSTAPIHVDKCVHEIVHEKASTLPLSCPAVCAWDAQMTYRELDQLATSFAHFLVRSGISRQSYVPVCFEKTALVVISILAIMKTGAAFVPIDGEAPKARLQGIVQDADATHVLCSPKYKELCDSLEVRTVVVDRQTIMDCPKNYEPIPYYASSDIAYIIFTSGSTGKPKGTLVSHSAFSSGALAHGPAMGMQSSSRVLQFASYTFDASVMEVLSTLLVGGCVCIPDDVTRLNDVAKAINDLNVNWALLTPSFAKLLSPSTVPGLKTLVLGGEAMSQSDVLTWADKTRLVNAYGPSEAAVVAAVNGHVTADSKFSNIGTAVGCRCFIVNQHNHDELVPVGAAGELVVQGPILASGYLKEKAKTEAAFVSGPAWLKRFQPPGMRVYEKIYKTGDLVRYAEDGSILYSGRKDNQTKLYGQRLELGEIEHHLRHDPAVQHALALIPVSGHFAKRLVGVLSFKESMNPISTYDGLEIVAQEDAAAHIARIGNHLRSQLQPFMVPSSWVTLIKIPMLPSGKLNSKRIKTWLEDMPEEVRRELSGSNDSNSTAGTAASEMEERLQKIWSKALDLPLEKTGLDTNFLFLGGDSISALQVISKCRAEGISTTVQDVIRSNSIRHLASNISVERNEVKYAEEELAREFGLSPMQKLYFEWVGNEQVHHFNQSVVLRLPITQSLENITSALKTLVQLHSMLRASFQKDESGQWTQKLAKDSTQSYRFTLQSGKASLEEITSSIKTSQESLNIEKGPIFAANLFESDQSGSKVLVLVAHHLIIDIVSWNIIQQDLDGLLTTKRAALHKSLPFQTWCRSQEDYTQAQLSSGLDFEDEVPIANFSYWGMEKLKNVYGAVRNLELEVDTATTARLLGSCNHVNGIELIDILLGSILFSFCRTFSDRKSSPAVFNEAHGREPWDPSLDLSHTVGWFTTISPVFLPCEAATENDIVNAIRWVKDLRSRTRDKGRQYFAHRMLTKEGTDRFSKHWPMEIAFNYSGQEKKSAGGENHALIQPMEGVSSKFDIDPALRRFALFEISAGIFNDNLKVSFSFPQNIRRQHSIKMWISALDKALRRSSEELLRTPPKSPLDNFPLLPLMYNGTKKLQDKLNAAGIASLVEVEDVYGSSPMQRGVLLSQVKNPKQYIYQAIFVPSLANSSAPLNAKKLAHAWQMVVQTHPSLRTVFIESLAKDGLMDQAVLKTIEPRIGFLQAHAANAIGKLRDQVSIDFTEKQPHHQFTICETTSGKIFCKLELSHSICDGTSVSIILKDLARFYDIGTEQIEPAPTNRDFISYLQKSSYESDLIYWRRYLQHIEPCSFPSLLDGPVQERKTRTYQLNLEDLPRLSLFCAQNGATLSNVLQLVWSLVLRVFTGNENICFGYITSGRDVPVQGIQDTVGLFISMLVCHLELDDNLEVNKALEQIQADYSDSMGHQAFSLSNMQHEMGGGQALFNTVFTFQRRFRSSDTGSDKLEYEVISAYDPGEYPLTVNVEALEQSIDVQFNYWTDFLCEIQVSNISDTFEQILHSIMHPASSRMTVGGITFCSEKQKQQIFDWNDASLPKVERCVHDIIYQQSQTLPLSAPAICSWDESLTYVKLMSLAKRLAKHLVAFGVGPESYVPLCFEKSTWAVVAILGVLEAGGAFVPLEPSYPESRIKYIIENVGARLVLCSERYCEKFADMPGVETFVVDESFPRRPQPNVPSGVTVKKPIPANAAYLIYTSGTTGLPKGTVISHHAFATGATSHAPAILMRQSSRVLQFSNLCFDASVMEILTTLITGACICIPSDEERMNNISGAINRMGVTWTLLTPSVANMLDPEKVPSLQVLVTGGEAMQSRHIAKWCNSTALVNAYGPSECAVIATTSVKVDLDGLRLDEDSSNIGRGVGCRCWVVNPHDHNQLMPVGSVGELIIEGNTVARGYLNNEGKTAKAFVLRPDWMTYDDNEIVAGHSRLVYKTGDLMRYNTAGDLIYIGRKDTQIKLNGLRIELGDIEHHVNEHLPDRMEAAVEMAVPAGQSTALAAFICPKENTPSTDALILPMSEDITALGKDLKMKLTKALPGYMVPSLYFPISHMPWTASGKLDRVRLRKAVTAVPQEELAPFRLASSSNRKKIKEPSTAMEKSLQRLWASFLGISPDSIGATDNFFDIGGDSVIGMKLSSAARSERISLSVLDIFRKPTLAEMAEACTELEDDREAVSKQFSLLGDIPRNLDQYLDEVAGQCKVSKERIADAYPCSPLQEGLITISTSQAGAYVAHNVFRLPESVDVGQFQAAWQIAVEEMDILRTRVVHTSFDTFVQVVLSDEVIDWHYVKSTREALDTAQLPEYNGGPLARFTIVTGVDRYFVWSIHHAIYDGWSMPRMLQRVEDIYCQCSPQPVQTPYVRYIGYLLRSDKEASRRFWQEKFHDLQCYHFPPALRILETKQDVDFRTLSHVVQIPHKPKITGVTLPTIIRGAWAILLSAHTGGSEDVVFGETLTGRDLPLDGIIDMLGPTLTTVPTRVSVRRESTVAEFLRDVHKKAAEVIPHQNIGLQNIKRLSAEAALACDFRNLLVIQTTAKEDDLEASKFWQPQDNGVSSKFFNYPLVVECDASGLSVRLDFHYNEVYTSKWLIERMVHQLEHALIGLCAATSESETRLGVLEIVSGRDIELLQKWNSYQPTPVKNTIGELFLQQAKRAPSAQAVCAWDGNFTYKELEINVKRLAGHLQQLGVKSETLVPYCVDKSRWAIVVQLGIMLAGGAMVPLDPSHPFGRHEGIIQDTHAHLLVCSPQYTEKYERLTDTVVPVDEQSLLNLPKRDTGAIPLARLSSKNAAYVIFTSGSTGRPKGVVVEHEAVCSSSEAFCKALLMDPSARVFNFASFTFDAAIMECVSPLTIGACVCIPNNEEKMTDLASAFNSVRPTWSFLTPSVASLIQPSDVPSLKVLVVGGEAVTEENVIKWGKGVTLVNGYGPTEASVITVTNRKLSEQKDPKIIGYAHHNSRAWIIDAADHDRLAPLGCVGELALEGPVLAREYLQDQEKTAKAFIQYPAWSSRVGDVQRLYKTGDLVKYNVDGSIIFCGRKDNQIKLNGQRIELGEIESRLLLHARIQHAVVVLPVEGSCKNKLVAVVSLADIASSALGKSAATSKNACTLIQGSLLETAQVYLREVREFLAETLPAYMIPAMWAIMEMVPILVSGKADKKQIGEWIKGLDDVAYKQLTAQESINIDSTELTKTAQRLREIWAAVFDRPLEQVDPGRSFMSQGGDSLQSMSIVSRCRKIGISITVQNVLQSKSLIQLAKLIDSNKTSVKPTNASDLKEKVDQPFELSPIQQLYFRVAGPSSDHTRNGRFNQSQMLKVNRHTSTGAIRHALEIIVGQHSMFRAKFSRDQHGTWQQEIASTTTNAYSFQTHHIDDLKQMVPVVAQSQTCLNINNGPLLAVDYFFTRQDERMLSLVAHHLIVDVVSWSIIIQQLEDLLTSKGNQATEIPVSFPVWLEMQQIHTHQDLVKNVLPFEIGPADIGYWDMAERPNLYGDTRTQSFMLKRSYTESILGDSNDTYRTQPVELLLSSLVFSFNRVFSNRSAPVIFNESHGRETWDDSIDLSGTVGWFTTLSPMYLPAESAEETVLDIVKRAKDQRRSIADSGRDYFSHRFLTQDGRNRCAEHDQMEILFNYTGRSQQQGDNSGASLLESMDIQLDEKDEKLTADVGPKTRRLALIEITANVSDGLFRFSFIYNTYMKHQNKIREWVAECQRTLENMTGQLLNASPEPTLSDFPLLPTNASGMARHFNETLPDVGIFNMEEVENIMVCAPMQDGLLLSQIRRPDNYLSYVISEVKTGHNGRVDVRRLVRAWQKVVDHHQMLRTTFVYSVCQGHAFDQVVMKYADGGAKLVQCKEEEVEEEFAKISLRKVNDNRQPTLPHQFSVCTTDSGKVFVKLECNHAVIDGISVGIIRRDLASAYQDRLEGPKPLYSDYIKYIANQSLTASVRYWTRFLKGVQYTHLPAMNPGSHETERLNSIYIPFDRFDELQSFCRTNELTLSNIMLAAWALVLRQYTAQDDICFGNLSAGRDAPVDGIQNIVGAFINMLVCRVNFASQKNRKLTDVFRKVQSDFVESLPYQQCPLARIQHGLELPAGEAMFNTACSLQSQGSSGDGVGEMNTVRFEEVAGHDPTEYAVTVNINTASGFEMACIKHWTSHISITEAEALSKCYADVLSGVLTNPDQTIATLEEPQPSLEIKENRMPPAVRRPPAMRKASGVRFQAVEGRIQDTKDIDNRLELPKLDQLNVPAEAYHKIVKDCVQEVLEQLIKSGEYTIQKRDVDQVVQALSTKLDENQKKEAKSLESSDTTSKTLRSLWSSLLDIPERKVHDNDSFLELGGDSILAMELASNAQNAGLQLTVADIFNKPTFSEMAHSSAVAMQKRFHKAAMRRTASNQAAITEQRNTERRTLFSVLGAADVETFIQDYICPKIGVFRGGITDVLPVTDFQALSVTGAMLKSRWMLNYFFFDGQGYLDLTRLKRAVFKLVQSFDILRTVFVYSGDRFWQVVLRKLQPQFQLYDTEEDLDIFTRDLRESGMEAYPRLGQAYVQISVVKKIGTNAHRIILRLSHAQYDGICLPKIIEALKLCYEGKEVVPSPSFSNYVLQATGPANRKSYDYWKALLRGSSMTSVAQREQPKYNVSDQASFIVKKTIKLPALNSKNVTPATIFKAAWALTLAQLTGKSDIVFGNLISGRNAAVYGVEDIVGPCLNIIPVRIALGSKATALDLLRMIQSQQVASMPYESLGFREIIQQCTDWPEWTYFSSVVQHQNISQEMPLRLDGRQYKVGSFGTGDNLSDFTLLSTPQEGGTVEVALGVCGDGTIPASLVEKALDMTCSFAETLVRSPGDTLPSFLNDSNRKGVTQIQDPVPPSEQERLSSPSLTANLRGIRKRELYEMVDILRRSWRIVLPKERQLSSSKIHPDTSFYSLGGDIIAMGALCACLLDEGYTDVRLEDLIKRSTMGEQIALLSSQVRHRMKRRQGEGGSEGELDPSSSSTLAATPEAENGVGERSPERGDEVVVPAIKEGGVKKVKLWNKFTRRIRTKKTPKAG